MAFYSDLSGVYDVLFPMSAAQRILFDALIGEFGVRRVADAGCGSGAHLRHFASAGISCVGFDPDPALVALAREKLSPYPESRVDVGGFADATRLVPPGIDLVLCLGNSLVHVPRDEAARFIGDVASLLSPGGGFLVQILNYDRPFPGEVADLPPLSACGGRITMSRRYRREGRGMVRFMTELRIDRGGRPEIFRNDIPLYPIRPEELKALIFRAGFSDIATYGDFARSCFAPDAEALVCIARNARGSRDDSKGGS